MKCKCGCGQDVRRGRVFVDKEHQLTWMHAGGAREIAALQPIEDKQRGGRIAGERAAQSGRLADAAVKGGALWESACGVRRNVAVSSRIGIT